MKNILSKNSIMEEKMEYIGHLKGERTQLLIEHLKGTAVGSFMILENIRQNFKKESGEKVMQR